MTVEDTKILSFEQIRLKKSSLPTILDVVEYISSFERRQLCQYEMNNCVSWWFKEGYYMPVSRDERHLGIPVLMPLSQATFMYYRGQNHYYEKCYPYLYRQQNGIAQNEKSILNKVLTTEFALVIMTHPIVCELATCYRFDLLALAQHYGFCTEYLDITNSKWAAAFFACTKCENDQYRPLGDDYQDGIGVMYLTNPNNRPPKEVENRIVPIGFQYFSRPSSQSAFGFLMKEKENFDTDCGFERVFFRHDLKSSEVVYHMAYQQKRYIPDDYVSKIAHTIQDPNYPLSLKAIRMAKKVCKITETEDQIKEIIKRHGRIFHEEDVLKAEFPKDQVETDWKEWIQGKREDLKSRIISPPLMMKL